MGVWKVIGAILAVVLGILTALEGEDKETLLVERGAALGKSRARVFSFVADMTNYAEVSLPICSVNVSVSCPSCEKLTKLR